MLLWKRRHFNTQTCCLSSTHTVYKQACQYFKEPLTDLNCYWMWGSQLEMFPWSLLCSGLTPPPTPHPLLLQGQNKATKTNERLVTLFGTHGFDVAR